MSKISLPEVAFSANTQVLENKPNADLVIWVGKAERAGCQAPDKVPCEHAGRGISANRETLGHGETLIVNTRGSVRRGLAGKRHALQVGAEVGVILGWWAIASAVWRDITASCDKINNTIHKSREWPDVISSWFGVVNKCTYLNRGSAWRRMGSRRGLVFGMAFAEGNRHHDWKGGYVKKRG